MRLPVIKPPILPTPQATESTPSPTPSGYSCLFKAALVSAPVVTVVSGLGWMASRWAGPMPWNAPGVAHDWPTFMVNTSSSLTPFIDGAINLCCCACSLSQLVGGATALALAYRHSRFHIEEQPVPEATPNLNPNHKSPYQLQIDPDYQELILHNAPEEVETEVSELDGEERETVKYNQDCFAFRVASENQPLITCQDFGGIVFDKKTGRVKAFATADGVGGSLAGASAAHILVESLLNIIDQSNMSHLSEDLVTSWFAAASHHLKTSYDKLEFIREFLEIENIHEDFSLDLVYNRILTPTDQVPIDFLPRRIRKLIDPDGLWPEGQWVDLSTLPKKLRPSVSDGIASSTLQVNIIQNDTLYTAIYGDGGTVVLKQGQPPVIIGLDEFNAPPQIAAGDLPFSKDFLIHQKTPLDSGDVVISFTDGFLKGFSNGRLEEVALLAYDYWQRGFTPDMIVQRLATWAGNNDDRMAIAIKHGTIEETLPAMDSSNLSLIKPADDSPTVPLILDGIHNYWDSLRYQMPYDIRDYAEFRNMDLSDPQVALAILSVIQANAETAPLAVIDAMLEFLEHTPFSSIWGYTHTLPFRENSSEQDQDQALYDAALKLAQTLRVRLANQPDLNTEEVVLVGDRWIPEFQSDYYYYLRILRLLISARDMYTIYEYGETATGPTKDKKPLIQQILAHYQSAPLLDWGSSHPNIS